MTDHLGIQKTFWCPNNLLYHTLHLLWNLRERRVEYHDRSETLRVTLRLLKEADVALIKGNLTMLKLMWLI